MQLFDLLHSACRALVATTTLEEQPKVTEAAGGLLGPNPALFMENLVNQHTRNSSPGI